ncbi:hypothetical protein [Pedobacter steynii]
MKPLKIYFKILQTGNGKYLKTKNEVNNLIVDVIDRNPTKSSTAIREITIEDFKKMIRLKRYYVQVTASLLKAFRILKLLLLFYRKRNYHKNNSIHNGGIFKNLNLIDLYNI